MRAAAAALTAACTTEGLRAVVRAAGITGDGVALDRDALIALGLGDAPGPELIPGVGDIRVLLLPRGASIGVLRDHLQRVSRRLASRAPHVLWLVAAVDDAGTQAGLVAIGADAGPRATAFLWEPGRIVDSDAETLCALAAVRADEDVLAHTRYSEILGRDALTRRFYRVLDARIAALASSMPARVSAEDARAVSLLYASRLLFLRFLEARGWLDEDRDFLISRFDDCMRKGGGFHQRVLLPLFFGTLNTPPSRRATVARRLGRIPFLNGGLFARSPLERQVGSWRYPDERFGALFDELFARFRFVAREDSATWSEASVDPEMLGRAFECLMAFDERRRAGVYFTPHALVAHVADEAIRAAFPTPDLRALRATRILDPACGSGAFLVYMLERIADVRRELGDRGTIADVRRDVLARSIFGVDRSPMAVWLCELRLWLSVVIESTEANPMAVPPLPNLDRNIRVGDALAGAGFGRDPLAVVGCARIGDLRSRYVRATGSRKQGLAKQLDREERRRVVAQLDWRIEQTTHARREMLAVLRSRDLFGDRQRMDAPVRRQLRTLRDALRDLRLDRRRVAEGGALPFSFPACFAEAHARGGFDIVLGNPPWVRLHRVPELLRRRFRESFEVFRTASWEAGAAAGGASRGFASQVDLAALFVERGVSLLREGGTIALLLPVKLWRALAGGGVRRHLLEHTQTHRLEDLSESRHSFDAVVYPSLLVGRRDDGAAAPVRVARHRRGARSEWATASTALPYDASPGAPWLILPPDARAAFDRVRAAGTPLSETVLGAPRLGVKSGCNSAFLVRVTSSARDIASVVDANGEHGSVELALLRPALRGDGIREWQRQPCDEWIVWTHDDRGAPLGKLPPRARQWLGRHYSALTLRSDAARARRWWSLFRTDAADATRWRVVWADIGRRPRAAVLPPGDPTVPLNSCYVVRCSDESDAWALAALLNSPLSAAWLNAIAEPARGGYRRYLGWTVGLLPVPRDWERGRAVLAAARGGDDAALLRAALHAYNLSVPSVAALLDFDGC
ncbi:MAG: Eco57I restriction-modification methylase domain-containing protein [Gemmatimonadaceae bacterium]